MTITTTLSEAPGGTDVLIVHEGIPDKVPAADNETGTHRLWPIWPGSSRRTYAAGYVRPVVLIA